MHTLEKMYPSLTLFSDLDWSSVTEEYQASNIEISFPEYLQQKALEGDCPPYLFELAFYELASFEAKNSTEPFPHLPGIYLNPTALFLNLEFDIPRMIKEASQGRIEVYEKPHVLCLYRNVNDELMALELTDDELKLLQKLEDGPQENATFQNKNPKCYLSLLNKGLVIDLLNS